MCRVRRRYIISNSIETTPWRGYRRCANCRRGHAGWVVGEARGFLNLERYRHDSVKSSKILTVEGRLSMICCLSCVNIKCVKSPRFIILGLHVGHGLSGLPPATVLKDGSMTHDELWQTWLKRPFRIRYVGSGFPTPFFAILYLRPLKLADGHRPFGLMSVNSINLYLML